MRKLHANTALVISVFLLSLLPFNAYAENFERGQELFQDQCHGCHGDLKFNYKKSGVKNLSDLKAKIGSWAAHSGAEWGESETVDVLFYLNKSFYHFKEVEE